MSDHIPFEVQAEIMEKLPTKSLMRFRSVSKPWKSLIDSPKFIVDYSFNQQHLLVSYGVKENYEQEYVPDEHKYVSFVGDDTFPLEKVSLPNPIPGLIITTILGSSQGLFCLYDMSREGILKTVLLWNPSIRKSIAIDVPHEVVPDSSIVIGFGVCPHTSDPKLVKIKYGLLLPDQDYIRYTTWQVEVYTLSSRAWRSIPTINQPRKSIDFLYDHVVVNGFIYWLAFEANGCNAIVSFDLTSEELMEVSLPDTLAHDECDYVYISKLKESLVVVEVVNETEQVYGIWMMEHGVSNSFLKLFTLNMPNASVKVAHVIGFWKNNEPICVMRTSGGVVDDVLVHRHYSEGINYIGVHSYRVFSYMETLLLLDC